MLEPSAARVQKPEKDDEADLSIPKKPVTVETRFGVMEFGPDNRVHLPVGLLGFTDYHDFGIGEMTQPELGDFRLLQCLEDHNLSFIVTPLRIDDGAVAREDLEDAALSVGVPVDNAAFLLIVTIRPSGDGSTITVNLRAPVVVDINRAIARQVVMANASCPIQQPLQLLRQS